jgi:hypothetical protein
MLPIRLHSRHTITLRKAFSAEGGRSKYAGLKSTGGGDAHRMLPISLPPRHWQCWRQIRTGKKTTEQLRFTCDVYCPS